MPNWRVLSTKDVTHHHTCDVTHQPKRASNTQSALSALSAVEQLPKDWHAVTQPSESSQNYWRSNPTMPEFILNHHHIQNHQHGNGHHKNNLQFLSTSCVGHKQLNKQHPSVHPWKHLLPRNPTRKQDEVPKATIAGNVVHQPTNPPHALSPPPHPMNHSIAASMLSHLHAHQQHVHVDRVNPKHPKRHPNKSFKSPN